MASFLLKLTTIFCILLLLHTHITLSFELGDTEEDEDYVLDTPLPYHGMRSRFLANIIKKGTRCDPISNNICNGISANNGTSLLFCCKKHCRNILRDKNNCGRCGHKCRFGELCCNGKCTNGANNVNHCGKCERKCLPGVKCEFGFCGYA